MTSDGAIRRFDPFGCPLEGAHLVEASAGTGKTFGLSWVVARLVIERAVPIEEILVVTFTNAATAELNAAVRERLKSVLDALSGRRPFSTPEQRAYLASLPDAGGAAALARMALIEIDRAAILSIHGFCQRTLSERAFESGVPFDASAIEDDKAFCFSTADDFWAKEVYEADPSRAAALTAAGWSSARARAIADVVARDPETEIIPSGNPVAREVDERAAAFVRAAFAARRGASATLTFNDLLYELDRALFDGDRGAHLAETLRSRYRAALVDEFQDTNTVQYRIFQRIFRDAGRPFFAFGDPKQSVYRFRGGDVFTYLRAATDPGVRRWSLDVCYRSDEGVVRAVNALFGGADPFRCGGRIDYRPASVRPQAEGRRPLTGGGAPRPPFEILYADPDTTRTEDLPPRIAADISRLLASETRIARSVDADDARVSARDIAVLTRTNPQARSIAEALRTLGIASSTSSDASVFETDEARLLAQILMGAARPADPSRVATAVCSPLFGLRAAEIREISRGEAPYPLWSQRMSGLARAFEAGGTVALVSTLLGLGEDEGVEPLAAELFSRAGGEAIASRFRHIAELAQTRPSTDGGDLQALARWLNARRRKGGPVEEAAQIRPETDGDAVKVMTVHKAKGLEFEVVYVPFASRAPRWAKKGGKPIEFHDPSREDKACADLGSADADAHSELARLEEEAEETRLLYVAVTRAKHLVKLVWMPPTSGRNRPGPADVLLSRHEPKDAGATRREVALSTVGALSARSEEAFLASFLSDEPAPPLFASPPPEEVRLAPPPEVVVAAPQRKASFSALVEGLDPARRAERGGAEPSPCDPEVPLGDFPAGRDAGTLVHEILSAVDFCDGDRSRLERAIAEAVTRRGFDPAWNARLADALSGALDTPLDADGSLRLNRIPRSDRLDELRFTFSAPRGTKSSRATVTVVAEAIGAGASDPWVNACAARARELDFDPFDGGVSGSIDLVFRRGDAFYIADYKTNRLGMKWEEYAPARLESAMLEHHYYLQYHLYTLALHRYLAQRIEGYTYQARFGGVFYLFLRGMSPARGQGTGVLFARPSEETIQALDALFGGRSGRRP